MTHVYVSGFVQGIGFRQYVKSQAVKLNLNGWIKNLPDGRVEAVFDGESESINKILEICRRGSFLADVKKINVDQNYKSQGDIIGFQIIKDENY